MAEWIKKIPNYILPIKDSPQRYGQEKRERERERTQIDKIRSERGDFTTDSKEI